MALAIEGFANVTEILRGGVYILVHKSEVVYVGKSKRMLNRIPVHLKAWAARRREKMPHFVQEAGIYYDEVHIRPCHPDQIDALEQAMIEMFKPKFNTQHKAPGPTSIPIQIKVGTATVMLGAPARSEPIVRRI